MLHRRWHKIFLDKPKQPPYTPLNILSNVKKYQKLSLVTSKGIIRHPAKHRMIKTVIQELIYFAGRLIANGTIK